MKGLLDVLDEYFVPTVKGETAAKKYSAAYSRMIDCIYDIQTVVDSDEINVDDLDSLFEEAMMERFGYKYVVNDTEYEYATDAAEAVVGLCNKLSLDEVVARIEDLGCEDSLYIGDICISTKRGW